MGANDVLTDIEIAQRAKLRPIGEIAARLGIPDDALEPYGRTKAKISLDWLAGQPQRLGAKLILVSAISPTPAGEGKTTTTVGLGDALNRIGKKAAICLREPSLGPVFGMKGGAAGGGFAQVVPMEDINLHFTGDFHAIGVANNLLAALIDNHIHHGNALGIDVRRITWKRVVDMNDRALRDITIALGGPANGYPRQDGFDIVVASEVMAIFCLAESIGRPEGAPREDRRRLYARPEAGPCGRSRRAGRDDGAAAGRAQAEPRADAREQPRVHPRRSVRQHRARLQLGDRDQGGAQARRLRRHRGRLRRRPGRREIHRHQVPQIRPAAGRLRAGRDDPRAQVPRRRGPDGADEGEPAGGGEGYRESRAAHEQRAQPLWPAVRGRAQSLRVGHRRRDRAPQEEDRPPRRAGHRREALGGWWRWRGGPGARRRRRDRSAFRRTCDSYTRTTTRCGTK